MKKCSSCKAMLEEQSFCRNRSRKDGLQNVCRKCFSKYSYPSASSNWKKANTDKVSGYKRAWDKRNRKYYRERYASLTQKQKLGTNISRLVRQYLNKNGKRNKCGRKWEQVVGYTIEDLRLHLESQFIDGMTWENYGKWHVDHIIPISFFVFDSIDDVEFKMCWRLENLQPLWAKDNLSKSYKLRPTG